MSDSASDEVKLNSAEQYTVRLADYNSLRDGQAIIGLLDQYARDPMGGAQPLSNKVRDNLMSELQHIAGAFTVLCFIERRAIGLVNCFQGFSTFKCQPLINIHDVVVHHDFRGQGLSLRMLNHVQHEAKERGCCKLTLEVLAGNHIAQAAYKKFGFDAYELQPSMGKALFWEKVL